MVGEATYEHLASDNGFRCSEVNIDMERHLPFTISLFCIVLKLHSVTLRRRTVLQEDSEPDKSRCHNCRPQYWRPQQLR